MSCATPPPPTPAGKRPFPHIRFLTAYFCPYAQRARIALEWYKGFERLLVQMPFELVECLQPGPRGYTKLPLLLENNPKGLVPTLIVEDNGSKTVVTESLDVIEYLDKLARDTDISTAVDGLLPSDDDEGRQRSIDIAKTYNSSFCTRFIQCFRQGKTEVFPEMVAALERFSSELVGPFYSGPSPCIVDVAVYPFAYGTAVLGASKGHEFTLTLDAHPQLSKYFNWFNTMSELDSVKKSLLTPRQLTETYDRLKALSDRPSETSRVAAIFSSP
ncbi:Glutathione S-transferase U1 [Perkinsus chesapeaki]|uniref:Glutathione S-transferase U1 n=1 Tax=Perkinsus chesapeaki TaxID=330153 RepID=A0A7J6M009_PERCH|nr:Glutathione S-transferase U1 [Perkinsus chesapeaki]